MLASRRGRIAAALVAPTLGLVISSKLRGNSTGFGIFFMSRARIRALARISLIHLCWYRKLAASVSSGFFAVAI